MYEWDIFAFPENTFYRSLRQGCPQSTIHVSILDFKNDLLPNCMVSELVWEPGVEVWMSVDDMV